MKKKLAVILCTEPEWGGEHQYVSTLMECLTKSAYKDLELMAICGGRYWKKWCVENEVRVLNAAWPLFTDKEQKKHMQYPLFSRIYCTYMTEFGKLLRREKVDAIFVTMQGAFIPNLSTKVIVPVHDLMHRYEGRFPEVSDNYENRELSFASKAKYAWCVLTESKTGKQQFMESYSDYMRGRLPHIVSLPYVAPKHILECEEEVLDIPSKYVFYPAQFWQHKNHMHLLEAIKCLVEELPDIHLVLVGTEKNTMRKVKHYIHDNGLDKHVTIKGFVSNGNIKYLYQHAVGLIMPSYFGPTNIPPLEAMALGCPVAVSDKYAMPEQVGDAGLLFDPDSSAEIAECIRKMWCDDDLRQHMIQKGYARINQWTKKEFGERFYRIVRKI